MDEAKLGIANPRKPSLDDLWRPNVYEGAAWYQREIEIPEAWRGKRLTLFLERCRWVTQAWLNGKPCGSPLDSLIAPHVHELGIGVAPGKHTLTLLVDNTRKIDLGPFVSALYGGTQGNLNGIVGKIELRATGPVWIDSLQVYQPEKQMVVVRAKLGNATERAGSGMLNARITYHFDARPVRMHSVPVSWARDGKTVEIELPVTDAGGPPRLWDEFSPNLYDLEVSLNNSETQRVTFGFRELASRGTQFTMNGRPLFLRGTLECQVFPLTGYPPSDVGSWRRIFQIEKSYGLNFIRFHSWCPPEAAFAAADIEGVMIQAEAPQANVQAGSDPVRDAFTQAEILRMVRTYGNHPSFCLMTLGNEYGGKDGVLSGWIDMLRNEDPRHLYSSASAGQRTANRQWTEDTFGRGVHGPGTAHDVGSAIEHETVPPVGHEIGQWVFFPNFDEMKKYTGVMQPRNFDIVRDALKTKGMLDLAPKFFQATGRQAVLLYKEEIELLLRTPGLAGFSLLDLHDYPSQGTALVGLLDPFWDSKGFIEPSEHNRYCGATVPLLRMAKRTYTTDEAFSASVEVANFGPSEILDAQPFWSITDQRGRELAGKTVESRTVPTGKLTALCSISTPLTQAPAPGRLTVTVGLKGTAFSNSWNIWVYPGEAAPQPPAGVVVSTVWDDAAKAALADGKTVLLLPGKRTIHDSLAGSFLPTFWSPVWFPQQKPDTMSILCDPKHPLFAQFPTDFYSDWQWYDLMQNSRSIILDSTPADYRPLVQVIDNFARNHKLGSVFEARSAKGKLLVCSIDLTSQSTNRPATRQFAKSLCAYLASADFKPLHELSAATLDAIFAPPQSGSTVAALGAKIVRFDSEAPGHEAANVLDDDPDSFWHTAWEPSPAPMPHQIVIDLGKAVPIRGMTYLPRQDMANGRIADFEIYAGMISANWSKPVAKGKWPNTADKQEIRFDRVTTARYLRIVAKSEVHGNAFASAAKFDVELEK